MTEVDQQIQEMKASQPVSKVKVKRAKKESPSKVPKTDLLSYYSPHERQPKKQKLDSADSSINEADEDSDFNPNPEEVNSSDVPAPGIMLFGSVSNQTDKPKTDPHQIKTEKDLGSAKGGNKGKPTGRSSNSGGSKTTNEDWVTELVGSKLIRNPY